MRKNAQFFKSLVLGVLSVLSLSAAQAQSLTIVLSIPPLAAMAEPLLDEEDRVVVLLQPGASPHGFQLRPSHMRQIQQADLVAHVGTGVDAWLNRALSRYSGTQLSMLALPDTLLLDKRSGGVWSSDHHQGHAHGHAHGHRHGHGAVEQRNLDGHLWLGLDNARVFIAALSEALQAQAPDRAAEFAARERDWLDTLAEREVEWQQALEPYQSRGFIVMHDAYQYFERQFGLQAAGTIHVNPELPPSAQRVQALRRQVEQAQVDCVFKEPQFPAERLNHVVRGLSVKVGQLDPLGFDGQVRRYDVFYDRLVQDFIACFTQEPQD